MQILKIGVATAGFELPLRDAVRRASAIGAQGVLLDARREVNSVDFTESARRQFQHLLSELGLQLAAFHFPLRRPLAESKDLDQRIDALKKAMSFGRPISGPQPSPSASGRSQNWQRHPLPKPLSS